MSDLIFEIGCEEMPARCVQPAIEELTKLTQDRLIEARLLPPKKEIKTVKSYGTPRRLAVLVEELAARQPDVQEQILGPPFKMAYDENGKPTKAAIGFAASQDISINKLQVFSNNKGKWIGYLNHNKGRPAQAVLTELLPELIQSLHFPKSMRWGTYKLRFVRPIHWLLALLDDQIIHFELAGIKSSCYSYGHRFLAPKAITLKHAKEYLNQLTVKLAYVEIDRTKRKEMVKNEVKKAATLACGLVISNTTEEKKIIANLIEEVTDLVELPIACVGNFDHEFLELPRPIIIAAMYEHQRYFSLQDKEGKLLPSFIAINNTLIKDINLVAKGHERVLRSRLADARFSLMKDTKRSLISRLEDLKKVIFHTKLGSSFDKVERITALASWLARQLAPHLTEKVQRTARLAKCDLVTSMVEEFPSLQGKIGEVYANYDGEDPTICQAIREHYKPTSANDSISEGLIGALVGIADRLDSICGLIGIGQLPSSVADPYALRRAAIAIIRTLIEKKLNLSFNITLDMTLKGLTPWLRNPTTTIKNEVILFFTNRLNRLLVEQGVPIDIVEAVLATGLDNLTDIRVRALAISKIKKSNNFIMLTTSLKRIMNILPKEEKEIPKNFPKKELFEKEAEHKLFAIFTTLEVEAQNCFNDGDYLTFLEKLSTLKEPIDKFFNEVMVIVQDDTLRFNRLALLNKIFSLFNQLAKFSLLQFIDTKI